MHMRFKIADDAAACFFAWKSFANSADTEQIRTQLLQMICLMVVICIVKLTSDVDTMPEMMVNDAFSCCYSVGMKGIVSECK